MNNPAVIASTARTKGVIARTMKSISNLSSVVSRLTRDLFAALTAELLALAFCMIEVSHAVRLLANWQAHRSAAKWLKMREIKILWRLRSIMRNVNYGTGQARAC